MQEVSIYSLPGGTLERRLQIEATGRGPTRRNERAPEDPPELSFVGFVGKVVPVVRT